MAEFKSAISSFRAISQNFVYADAEGNIGLNTGGGIAIRKGNGSLIRPGETTEYDWKGYVPFDQLPSQYNPDTGFVSSANNRTVDADYPYYISTEFAMPYRIDRIREMLSEKQLFTVDDFKRIITDQHSAYAKLLTPVLLSSLEGSNNLSAIEKYALDNLKKWDYEMNAAEVAPAVFEFIRPAFARNLLSDDLGDLYPEINSTMRDYCIYRTLTGDTNEWTDNLLTDEKESTADLMRLSFSDAVKDLSEYAGADTVNWKWGNLHKFVLEHPMGSVKLLDRIFGFNSPEYSAGGSNHTVAPYSYKKGFRVNHGASERHIFNTADWDNSFTVIPTGTSGIPASEFYLSQAQSYVNGEFYKEPFSEGAVMAAAKYVMVYKPAK
jgi:penicillin amidase